MKKAIAIILCLLTIFSCLSMISVTAVNDDNSSVLEENITSKICELAKSQIGKQGVDYCNGQTKAWKNGLTEWDAIFMAYLMEQVGISPRNDTAWSAYIPTWVDNAKSKGIFYSNPNHPYGASNKKYTPSPGDMIIFQYSGSGSADHVGIITEVDNSGNLVTIEGNTDGDDYDNTIVAEHTYNIDSKDILGYISMCEVYKERQDNPYIPKKDNPVKVYFVNKKVRYSKLKKSDYIMASPLYVHNAKGNVTFAKISAKSSKNLSVFKKTGKIQIKKKTNIGTYKIKIKIKVSGTKKYRKKTVNRTIRIRIY